LGTALVLTDQALARRTLAERATALERDLQRVSEGDHRKDEFLATLAHELRNLLGPVVNSLQVMKRADPDPELLERVRAMMERQVHQMARLVDDLLDVNRLARNQLALKQTRVDLGLVLAQAAEASRPAFEAAEQTLTIRSLPDPVYLEADSDRLTQVFGNLLTNACKFTERGGRIVVSLEEQGSDVVVRVTDNGIGIPPELLATVFERFVQVGRAAERADRGLGIGLALARQLVELHGGTITAYSEGPGRGSEFVVRLPIITDRCIRLESLPVLPPSGRADTLRILLVDDSRDAVESLALLLALEGHQTRTAYDGVAALELAEAYRPDVILLDIGLPRMNGYDVCRAIRATPWGMDVAVIALTGWGHEDDHRRTVEAGFTAHLVKPVDYAGLTTLLAQRGQSPLFLFS
jgi:CheY-like chemotaxis protein